MEENMSKLKKTLFRKRRKHESAFKYIMGLLHLWLGLLSGIILIIVCLSGCLYAFKNQVSDWINRDKVFIESVSGKIHSPDDIKNQLEKEGKNLSSITIPEGQNRSFVVSYKNNGLDYSVYYNQYTGKELGTPDVSFSHFFEVVLDLHRNLLMGNTGRQINGIGVLMFCFLLFSGFILWIPKKLKHLKQALTIKFSAKFFRVNYDLHNTLGFYTFLLLFFMAVTGLYVTYPWVKNALIISMGGTSISNIAENTEEDSNAFNILMNDMLNRQNEKNSPETKKEIPLQQIIKSANKILPYKAATTIELPNEENPRYTITKINTDNWLGAMLPDEITFDKEGNLKSKDLFADKPLDKQFTSLSKPLHTGEILGLKSIILYFMVCLIGLSLPVTGFLIWWHRYSKLR